MYKSLRLTLALSLGLVALPLLSATNALSAGASSTPQCVVSMSPTATETLYAIGAGKQVQAVDTDSNYPTSGLPKKRINALNPSVESVVGICKVTKTHPSAKPDLVIISYNANNIQQKLTGLGIKVILQGAPSTLSGAYQQMMQLGTLTGHKSNAAKIVTNLKTTIAKDVASVPKDPSKVVTTYYELDPTYYSLASNTFVGSLLKSLGVVNIADAKSTSADAGYPQLSSEYIISANPNLIFLADTICCHVNQASLAQRTGFSTISAVANGHVVGLSDDVASRWGPRLGILMNQLTAGVKATLSDSAVWK
ncbi:MAG TPA: ABC transporter substrate-binding protein [Acidimicrobiales bacterium]|jgi:iron complex transport system substrate-binding protein|nr:ABC transporter substrate-binding protein [Acidimicrobiales bacterium]